MDDLAIAALLRRTELFSGLDEATARKLAGTVVTRTYRRNEVLFHQGDPGDALFVLVEGSIAVVVTSEDGERMVPATLRPPDVLGQIALLDGGPRSASAEAIEDTTTLVLHRAGFLKLLEDPAFVEPLLRSLGGLIRRLSEQAADFVFLDLPARVAKMLLRLAAEAVPDHGDQPVELAMTQGRLAEMVGATRQSVNQVLHEFQTAGLIEVNGRRLLVAQPALLRGRATGQG